MAETTNIPIRNKIKAIMHNEALNNVKEKINVSDYKKFYKEKIQKEI